VHSHLVERPQVLVSPESWIYEIGLGRVMLFEAGQESFSRDMGFRGHLELVFRKTNYSAESKALGQSYLVDYDLLSRALFLKWGAGTFLWGNGLVEQKPGWLGFNLEGQIGLPLKNDHTVVFDVAVQTYLRCGFRGAKCGFDFQVFRANSVKSNETSLAVQSFYKFGPYFEWQGQSAFSFNVGLPWGFIRSAPLDTVSYNRSKKYPGINVGVSYGL
jgi:hypothetical protein